MSQPWRKCSSCKKDILTNQVYYLCSVSTCRGSSTNYVFCSVNCWDAHVPTERHRPDTAGAIEKRAPSDPNAEQAPAPKKILPTTAGSAKSGASDSDDVLVVVTKVRKYIADKSGMNTSSGVYELLTSRIKTLCDMAIDTARSQGRKTVMDRDVP